MKRLALLVLCTAALAAAQTPAPGARPGSQQNPTTRPVGPAVPLVKDLRFPPLKTVEIPPVETFTLPNGMKVFLLEDHDLPLVHGAARIRTGNLFDPPDKIGLATMTGMVMRTGGTQQKAGDELDTELENVAASVESSIEETYGSVSFSALKENTAEVMGIFHDVLTAPEFREGKIELAKSQMRSAISRRNDDAHGITEREFGDIVYGENTPYGWQEQYATIGRISRADLQNFYKRYFFPANVLLAVWGDFNSAEMKANLEKLFAGWTVKQDPVPPFPKVVNKPEPGVFLATKPDVSQTFFAIGQLGGELRDKDLPALEIMADILGGGFQSRLFRRVRTSMGNAYDISAGWGANYDHPGLFQIAGSTKSVSTVETFQAIREEVERIRTSEVTDEELRVAKDTAINGLVFAFDTRSKTILRLLNYEYYGYPRDFIQQYQKALTAVTKADVLRVAKSRLDPAAFTYVATGNPEEFGLPLSKLGLPVKPVDLTIPGAPKEEAAESSEESLQAGKQMLAKAQQAAGGAEKLAAVKDYVLTATFQLDPSVAGGGGMQVKETEKWVAPTFLRQDNSLPNGTIQVYCDGKSGWISSGRGTAALVNPQLKKVQGDVFRNYLRMLLSDHIEGRVVNAVEENTVEIREGDNTARMTFDPQTGLPKKLEYEAVVVRGAPDSVEETYSDYREVGGIKLPFRIEITQGGKKYAQVTVQDWKLNTGLKAEELAKRP